MIFDICEGCGRASDLTYSRWAGMELCDFCYEDACEEEDEQAQRDWENNWSDGEVC